MAADRCAPLGRVFRCSRAYLRSAALVARFLQSTSWSGRPFTFPALRTPTQCGSSLSRVPPDPGPARAQRMLRSHTARRCSTGASSSCSWVPTPACHALLGPAGRQALTGMVPSSQTRAPRGPHHHQAFVPEADLTNASDIDKFRGKDLLPRSPGLRTASLGLPHQESRASGMLQMEWAHAWYRTCVSVINGLHG